MTDGTAAKTYTGYRLVPAPSTKRSLTPSAAVIGASKLAEVREYVETVPELRAGVEGVEARFLRNLFGERG